MSISLKQELLDRFPQDIYVPEYDRTELSPGILHIGVGNFHRAHAAIYLDRLFELGKGLDWGIVGAGIRPTDEIMREKLMAQDYLTTVVELDPDALSARVVTSIIDYVPVNNEAIVKAMIDPRIRIVSLTITEGGYYLNSATGKLAVEHLDIRADASNPQSPRTIFGMIIKAIAARRDAGIPSFAVLSCDNLPGNGNLTRASVVTLARLSDPELAEWIETEVAFPNSMVDCITPASTERERNLVRQQFGIEDAVPVVCEPFRQWVIEDHFPSGRPPLEQVGVEFVEDVTLYELMKLRILNAGHASMCYAAALLGYHYVHDAMSDPDISLWLRTLLEREAIPTLQPLQGVDYLIYCDTVLERFSNPRIGDTIPRLAKDGSDRQPKFVLPTLQDLLHTGKPIDGMALEVAIWCRYCRGSDEFGAPIPLEDPRSQDLRSRAIEAADRPNAFLENSEVFGQLVKNSHFSKVFSHTLKRLDQIGVRAAIKEYAQI